MPVKLADSSSEAYNFARARRFLHYQGPTPGRFWADLIADATEGNGDEDWDEVELMGPSAHDLLQLAQQFPAPDGWD